MSSACIIVAFLLVAAASCKKGDIGPVGPAGATGATGPKGDTGTANVMYSAWLDAKFQPELDNNGAVTDYFVDITTPKLTNTILTSGDMKVYLNLQTAATPAVVPIPYAEATSNVKIVPYFLLGMIELVSNVDASTRVDAASGSKILQYRYILIPGGKSARSAINWNNYAEVKKYLNLKD